MSVLRVPHGSEWRKWDLHVHAPGTKLSDGYEKVNGELDWKQFCQIIHESDVVAFGITDYFSLDGFFEFTERYQELYPNDKNKVFFPNLELRLPEALNSDGSSVHIHLIFRPDLTEQQARTFLGNLETQRTVGKEQRTISCNDLESSDQYQSATVSRDSIEQAIKGTFGKRVVHQDHVLIVTSAKGDGIRPGGKGSVKRKKSLVDEIDKQSDAFFGGPSERDHFLDSDRLETHESIRPKPVFGGCDAHNFDDLEEWLGKSVNTENTHQVITWIKADPSFEGLLQTLIEPESRVAIQTNEPDQKEPYKVISKVKFSDTNDFPDEIVFNRNLNAIIGSRSSGKSALLAYIAHAIDPKETIDIQTETSNLKKNEVGPAAGKTWSDVSAITCEVEWQSAGTSQGRVIYIPQNSLHSISEHPNKVTQKITPALFRTYPEIETAYSHSQSNIESANEDIKAAVDEWFSLSKRIAEIDQKIRDLGDRTAIAAERDRLQGEIDKIKVAAKVTDEEVAQYQEVAGLLESKNNRVDEIAVELEQLSPYAILREGATEVEIISSTVQVTVKVRPSGKDVPESIASRLDDLKDEASSTLTSKVENALADAVVAANSESTSLQTEIEGLKTEHADLITKHEANEELSRLVDEHKKQLSVLGDIEKQEKSREFLLESQEAEVDKIVEAINDRAEALNSLKTTFRSEERVHGDLAFGIEADVPTDVVERVSLGFNKNRKSEYLANSGKTIDYEKAQANPADFLEVLRDGKLELNKDYDATKIAIEVLLTTKDVRFTAELDEDRIGGFSRSSMTPGKQALFALILILNESQEPWPLLIDQPEDDLDSRSIYETIVPYLMERKRERQIIMVSHNANLVVGADSEEIIVANRHGADRPNKNNQTFDYLTGSLEHSQPLKKRKATLGRMGIREHACKILDGGEEAFKKRREKYKI